MKARSAASPLQQMLNAGGIRRVDVAARAGVASPLIAKLCKMDPREIQNVRISSLQRVALAMGCAPAELVPWLTAEPRDGLLYERGVKTKKPNKGGW